MISGTIRNSVNMAMMDSKWQFKKQEINSGKARKAMTADELLLDDLRRQAEEVRKREIPDRINAKLMAGEKLTPDEINYLRKHNPQALVEYEKIQQERAGYKRQLKQCKTKEEVEQLKVNKLNGAMAMAKEISSNPNIPKSEKLAQMCRLMQEVAGIDSEHIEFTQSARFASLPENEEEAKREKEVEEEILTGEEETAKNESAPEFTTDEVKDKLRELMQEYSPAKETKTEAVGTVVDLSTAEADVSADVIAPIEASVGGTFDITT